MELVQVTLKISDEIFAGIASGKYKLYGSVVRDLSGAIVTHLQEVKLPANPSAFNPARIVASLKDPKVLAVIGIGVVATIVVSTLVAGRKKPEVTPDLPTTIENYDSSLSAYLIAIHGGSLDAGILDDFIAALNTFQEEIESGVITIEGSTAQSASLLDILREFTTKFAEANGFDLSGLEEPTPEAPNDTIPALLHYLNIQKRIIEAAE
jgi:hypothetical protein